MTPKCATAVRAAAAGRPISEAKMQAIEDAISGTMRELARQDRHRWAGLTRDQRMAEATAKAMEDVQAEAALKEYRAGLQVLRAAETDARVLTQQQLGTNVSRSQALARDAQNVENAIHGVRNEAMASLGELFDAAANRDGTGLLRNLGMRVFGLDNPQMTADMVREVFASADGSTGNRAAKEAAKAWLDVIERMRQRFNAAGGSVGKLGYGYLSQAHDAVRVMEAGAERWASKVLPLLDREQYVKPDGSLMNDAEVSGLLRSAHETIATGGTNKTEPGQFAGTGARAKRGSDHRVLHFKDGDAWIDYMKDFGEGSLYDSMIGHIGKMARDIGLVEAYGPNAAQTYRVQADIAQRADGAGTLANRAQGNKPEAYWELISGNAGAAENRLLSRVGQDLRNVQTAAKITAGPLAAFGDMATIATSLHFNRLPYFEMIANVGRQFNADERAWLQSHGVIADSLTNDVQRMVGDHFSHSLTGQVTNSVMRLSLLNAWTDGLRAAFAQTLMRNFSTKLGKGWGELDGWDQQLLSRKGIGEAEWAVISRAAPTERNGLQYLTADAVRATGDPIAAQAATKWLGFVNDEAQFAVVNPDLATRAIVTGGASRAGTFTGEAWRSFAQFKSFPVAMVTRHWQRVLDTPQGLEGAPLGFRGEGPSGEALAKIGMLSALMVSATLMGAIQTQGRQVIAGKDPIDMTGEHAGKFWGKAFAAGGGGGFFADVLLAPLDDPSRSFEGKFGMAGPVAGSFGGLIDVAKADKNQGARAVQWVNDQLPGVDIWFLRAAWEHWALHNAQEAINPGYTSRISQRAQKQWGQDMWWAPGEALPDRAPDLAAAVGQ
jgi:hypothetical protein